MSGASVSSSKGHRRVHAAAKRDDKVSAGRGKLLMKRSNQYGKGRDFLHFSVSVNAQHVGVSRRHLR